MENKKGLEYINGYGELEIPFFHNYSKGEGVRVAILDSEIELSHVEFKGANIVNNEIVKSIESNYHGTAVASLIVGNTIGVAPNVEVHHLKILSDIEDDGPAWANAMHYIIANDIDIACMSIGTKMKLSLGMSSQIQKAKDRGILIVAPTGNEGVYAVRYPAGYDSVVAVGGLDSKGNVSRYSNTPGYTDIHALSENVLVADIGPVVKYSKRTGTSFSNAIVAGQLSLIKSYMRKNNIELNMFDFIKEYKKIDKKLNMRDVKKFLDEKYSL